MKAIVSLVWLLTVTTMMAPDRVNGQGGGGGGGGGGNTVNVVNNVDGATVSVATRGGGGGGGGGGSDSGSGAGGGGGGGAAATVNVKVIPGSKTPDGQVIEPVQVKVEPVAAAPKKKEFDQDDGYAFQKFKSGYSPTTNVKYTVVVEPTLSWTSAMEACIKAGQVFASVNTIEDLNFLNKLIADAGVSQEYFGSNVYLGAIKIRDGFEWVDSGRKIGDFFWGTGAAAPSNAYNNENCVTIWNYKVSKGEPGGNRNTCSFERPFICMDAAAQ